MLCTTCLSGSSYSRTNCRSDLGQTVINCRSHLGHIVDNYDLGHNILTLTLINFNPDYIDVS